MKSVFAAAMLVTAMIQVAHAQDVAAGEQSFKKCLPCHAVGEGAEYARTQSRGAPSAARPTTATEPTKVFRHHLE
jgi:hypothetical protein